MSVLRLHRLYSAYPIRCYINYVRYFNCSPRIYSERSVSNVKLPSPPHFLKEKINEIVVWYEQVTGMDEVRLLQNRVIEAQDKFIKLQDNRREASKNLAAIQFKLKEIYAELDTTSRGEERYLQLITQEHAILKEERRLEAEFVVCEREERESFTLLSNFVKESHEKERAQAERTKYWSVIGSVLGTICGVLGSSINNEFKMRELRKLVKETSLKFSSSTAASSTLAKHEQELTSILAEIKNVVNQNKEVGPGESSHMVIGRLDQLLHNVSQSSKFTDQEIYDSLANLNKSVSDLRNTLETTRRFDGQLVAIPADVESLIIAQQYQTRMLLVGMSIAGVLVPIVMNYFIRVS